MAKVTEEPTVRQAEEYSPELLSDVLRQEIRRTIERVLGEELSFALRAVPYQRTPERTGYRNGTHSRDICTSYGTVKLDVPRGRVIKEDGASEEFESSMIGRYRRRSKEIDEAILAMYLSGCNTRRVKRALGTLLAGGPLSKSAVSRVVAGLKDEFEQWSSRDLKELKLLCLYADAIYVKVRMAGRVCRLPVLVTIAVLHDGSKVLLGLAMKGSESEQAWTDLLRDLQNRGLAAPRLLIADGNKGLLLAAGALWPTAQIQRCAVHKLRNVLSHAPKHAWQEIKEDYNRIVYADSEGQATEEWSKFTLKWRKLCPAAVRSLNEAGEQLLTFFKYPKSQWKSLRTTNVIERVQEEFRRRVKTQAALPTEDSVMLLIYGLVAGSQITMNRIHGYKDLTEAGSSRKLAPVG